MIDFGGKCIQHPSLKRLFPINDAILNNPHNVRSCEMNHVNHAKTSVYQKSAIPSIQRRLNKLFMRLSTDWITLWTHIRLYFRVIVQTS